MGGCRIAKPMVINRTVARRPMFRARLHLGSSAGEALPALAAETYTADATASSAVQSNPVCLTPCTAAPSISFRAALYER